METTKEKQLSVFDIDLNESGQSKLIVYNDDYNTFSHVIRCFTSICKITPDMAYIKASLIHKEGKCMIKRGDAKEMTMMKDSLIMRGLNAKTEKIEE